MNQGVESRDGSRETNLFKITFQEHNPHVGPNQSPVFRSKVDQKLQRRFNLFLLMYVRQLIATLKFFVPAVSPGSLQRRLRSAVVRSASGGFGFCVLSVRLSSSRLLHMKLKLASRLMKISSQSSIRRPQKREAAGR